MFHHIEKEQEWRRKKEKPEGFETLRASKPIGERHADDSYCLPILYLYDICSGCWRGRTSGRSIDDGRLFSYVLSLFRTMNIVLTMDTQTALTDWAVSIQAYHVLVLVPQYGSDLRQHPHLTPAESWKSLFDVAASSGNDDEAEAAREIQASKAPFTPSQLPAHEEMLRLLRESEPDTITIVAIGPMTNLALAAAADPETFLRAKEVVVMGGAVEHTGNVEQPPPPIHPPPLPPGIPIPPFNLIKAPDTPSRRSLNLRNQMTPVAEFNTYADSIAAARVYALTSPNPKTTMPPVPPAPPGKQSAEPPPPFLKAYPEKLSRRLKVKLFPLGGCTPSCYTQMSGRD